MSRIRGSNGRVRLEPRTAGPEGALMARRIHVGVAHNRERSLKTRRNPPYKSSNITARTSGTRTSDDLDQRDPRTHGAPLGDPIPEAISPPAINMWRDREAPAGNRDCARRYDAEFAPQASPERRSVRSVRPAPIFWIAVGVISSSSMGVDMKYRSRGSGSGPAG